MGHKIRTKWLNQILKVLKETWIQPCSSVTSFPGSECKHVCVDSSGANPGPVVRQELWASTEGIWSCVISEHRPEKVPTAGPCVSSISQVNLLASVNCRQHDLFTVPGCRCPSSDTRNRVGKSGGCSVLSWKNWHLNLQQLKWELSPII